MPPLRRYSKARELSLQTKSVTKNRTQVLWKQNKQITDHILSIESIGNRNKFPTPTTYSLGARFFLCQKTVWRGAGNKYQRQKQNSCWCNWITFSRSFHYFCCSKNRHLGRPNLWSFSREKRELMTCQCKQFVWMSWDLLNDVDMIAIFGE